MAKTKPLVLLDPHPRTSAMIFTAQAWDRLQQLADVVTSDAAPVDAAVVDECLPRLRAIVGQTPMPEARLQRATALRAIFNVEGNFLPNVDYAYCFRHGIRVAVAAPAFAAPVAEYALALTLDLLRGVTRAERAFRDGSEAYGWRGNRDAVTLFGADVGIVGFGNIGRALVPLLAPFRCRIRVHDPWLPGALIREHGAEPAWRSRVRSLAAWGEGRAAEPHRRRRFRRVARGGCGRSHGGRDRRLSRGARSFRRSNSSQPQCAAVGASGGRAGVGAEDDR